MLNYIKSFFSGLFRKSDSDKINFTSILKFKKYQSSKKGAVIFNPIEKLIINIYREMFFGKLSEVETEETKKCENCLKRISISYNACPYCRTNFIFPFSPVNRQ